MLKSLLDRVDKDRKRMDQDAAKVVQALQKLAVVEAAAAKSALAWATGDEELQQLLVARTQAEEAAKPKVVTMCPAPKGLPEDQQAAWNQQAEAFMAKAVAELQATLAAAFPVPVSDPGMEIDGGAEGPHRSKREASPSRVHTEPEGQKPRIENGGNSGGADGAEQAATPATTPVDPKAASILQEKLAAKAEKAKLEAIMAAQAEADAKEL